MPNDAHGPVPDPHRDDHGGKDAPPSGPGGPNGPSGPNRPAGPLGPRRNPMIWLLILGALVLWNVVAIWPRGAPQIELPYSTFIAQVNADAVASVQIGANTITGTFVHPYTPPTPSPAAAAATSRPTSPAASQATSPATNQATSQATSPTTSAAPSTTAPQTGSSAGTTTPASATSSPAVSGKTGTGTNTSVNPATNTAATPKPAAKTASEPPTTYTSFTTNFPVAVGDPTLMPLLKAHDVTIAASPPSNPWLGTLLLGILPIGLLLLFLVWMGRRAQQSSQGLFGMGQSKARRYDVEHPTVTFTDVAGADEAKEDLQEVVDFLRHPARYHALGARTPKGFLLVGPPGTGKTLLARAVAGEAKVPFFNLSASEFVEMFVGVGASRVRDLFQQAHDAAPSIVFIDELDAVGRRRGAGMGTVNDEREQTLNQMLVAMDGFDERHEVIVLAATNRPDVLDPALLRPGRFDREVTVGLPDQKGREAILRIHARPLPLGDDVDLGLMARSTTGFSGADLANLCNQAALEAARRKGDDVTMADFEMAVDRLVLGDSRSLIMSEADRKVIAYHEAGHAVVAWYSTHADPVRKVTIIPHGRALGVTEQSPEADTYNLGETALLERLSVMMGGRASEALVLGEITTGAENDFAQATALARRMVARWGMGPMGPVTLESDDQQPFLGFELAQGRGISEATAARLDEAVQTLLRSRFDDATALLRERRDRLDALASALLATETVGPADLVRLLGPRAGAGATETPAAPATGTIREPHESGEVQGVHGAAAAAAMLRS